MHYLPFILLVTVPGERDPWWEGEPWWQIPAEDIHRATPRFFFPIFISRFALLYIKNIFCCCLENCHMGGILSRHCDLIMHAANGELVLRVSLPRPPLPFFLLLRQLQASEAPRRNPPHSCHLAVTASASASISVPQFP